MVEVTKEISSWEQDDSHALNTIMVIIIVTTMTTFSNSQITIQLNQKKDINNNILLAQIMVVK